MALALKTTAVLQSKTSPNFAKKDAFAYAKAMIITMNKIRIGECILSYRKARGMTQGEFGKLLGVSAVTVSKWERELCYPDIFLLPNISNLLGVSIDEMMGKEHTYA